MVCLCAVLSYTTIRDTTCLVYGKCTFTFNRINTVRRSLAENWANIDRAEEVLEALFGLSVVTGLVVALQLIG